MNVNLIKSPFWAGLLVILVGSASMAFAQDQEEPSRPIDQMDAEDQMGRESPEMREMARAMKSMADMCQMMMQREMQSRPYWIAAIAVVGTLLALALILFIVLEIQWIRFFGLRVKIERKNLR